MTRDPSALNTATMLDAALAYAALGWPVLVLHGYDGGRCTCGSSSCKPCKHPRTLHGVKDATTDAATIREWWTRWPVSNIGLACSAFVVVDVDIRADKRGDVALVDLVERHGSIGWSLSATTGSGGQHYLFAMPERAPRNGTDRLGVGIDVKSAGGYIVAPPSVHVSGGRYAWNCDGAELSTMAPWLAEMLAPPVTSAPAELFQPSWDRRTLTNAERCLRYIDRMPLAVSGAGGHDAFFRVACVVVRGFSLPDGAALEVLRYYSSRCSPPWSEREIRHKLEQAKRSRDYSPGYLLEARG